MKIAPWQRFKRSLLGGSLFVPITLELGLTYHRLIKQKDLPMTMHRHPNGSTPEQQAAADRRYRERQRVQREWIAAVAEEAGISKESLLTPRNAALIAEVLRRERSQ